MLDVDWLLASITRYASDQALAAKSSGDSELEEQFAGVLWTAGKVLRQMGFTAEVRWSLDSYATACCGGD